MDPVPDQIPDLVPGHLSSDLMVLGKSPMVWFSELFRFD